MSDWEWDSYCRKCDGYHLQTEEGGTGIVCTDIEDEYARLIIAAPKLLTALEDLLDLYVDLANSGDCGQWNPEEVRQVQEARTAIAKARA